MPFNSSSRAARVRYFSDNLIGFVLLTIAYGGVIIVVIVADCSRFLRLAFYLHPAFICTTIVHLGRDYFHYLQGRVTRFVIFVYSHRRCNYQMRAVSVRKGFSVDLQVTREGIKNDEKRFSSAVSSAVKIPKENIN